MTAKEQKIKEKLTKDPGNPVFAEFAEYLRRSKKIDEAFCVCYQGLTSNPTCFAGRLVLARLYYEKHWVPFAVRELATLQREFPDNQSLLRLLQKIDPDYTVMASSERDATNSPSQVTMVAETEFDLGEIDLLDN